MAIVFAEYKVYPEKREQYLQWMQEQKASFTRLELYEGSDQPGLFVEVWRDCGYDDYLELKRIRHCSDNSSRWTEMAQFVPGGAGNIHIWHFCPVEFAD